MRKLQTEQEWRRIGLGLFAALIVIACAPQEAAAHRHVAPHQEWSARQLAATAYSPRPLAMRYFGGPKALEWRAAEE